MGDMMAEMMQGLLGGGIWSMPMVQTVIFPASARDPAHLGATSGPIRDGTIEVAPDVVVGYRAYVADEGSDKCAVHFHGNAEVCGDADDAARVFHAAGFNLVSVDYRGYGWSTGSAGVTLLTGDAERVLDFILAGRVPGIAADAKIVAWGRSIGAMSAVHLAAYKAAYLMRILELPLYVVMYRYRPARVAGLIVDSGLMAIASLPMVRQLAESFMGPSGRETLKTLADPTAAPFGATTLAKAATVGCPALVVHGDNDEIVPARQGAQCYEAIGSRSKRLEALPNCGHNDVFLVHGPKWTAAVSALLADAAAADASHPARCTVETEGLSAAAFNGKAGTVVGPARAKDAADPPRARVKFDDAALGEKALKLANLRVVAREPFL